MGTLRKNDRKETITIRIKSSLIVRIKEIKGYNVVLEDLIEKYLNELDKSDVKKD